ncbi:MAG: DUF1127 domain-containing protein [Rhizobiales bacterium]|nr:DUF1127 domain-containing protein [Hyphomicrobiales bacterium]MBI3674459.1 DUF1127 domain-containing protein [Hyphomicrobiales bacterium]
MTTTTIGREAIRIDRIGRPAGLLNRLRNFFALSRAERQLAQLDDRMLADIGLKRSEIHKMVWGS